MPIAGDMIKGRLDNFKLSAMGHLKTLKDGTDEGNPTIVST